MASCWRRFLIPIELCAIFLVIPFAVWSRWIQISIILIPLYLISIYAVAWLVLSGGFTRRELWFGESPDKEKLVLKKILLRFAVVATAGWLFVSIFYPEKLFNFPLQHTGPWLWLIVLYPVLSVYPQEILYRAFFFTRYKSLFADRRMLVLASAALFGGMHIVFDNIHAIWITLIGGYLFADTYSRSHSLRMVFLEHTLYGNFILTIGLGEFFLYGERGSLLN